MSDARTSETTKGSDPRREFAGRLLALDLGEKRVGVAVSDEMLITVRPLPPLRRTSWKALLRAVTDLVQRFDARGLVIGLPLNFDGVEGRATEEARRRARDFGLSLKMPVYLQDERLTSHEAEDTLRAAGFSDNEVRERVDSQAAVIILLDFIANRSSFNFYEF